MAFLRAYMREGRCRKTTAPKGARTCSKQPTLYANIVVA